MEISLLEQTTSAWSSLWWRRTIVWWECSPSAAQRRAPRSFITTCIIFTYVESLELEFSFAFGHCSPFSGLGAESPSNRRVCRT